MTEPPPPPLLVGMVATVVAGTVLDLFALLLLPFRVGGHLVPVGPALDSILEAAAGRGAKPAEKAAPVGPLAPRRGGVPRPDMPDPAG